MAIMNPRSPPGGNLFTHRSDSLTGSDINLHAQSTVLLFTSCFDIFGTLSGRCRWWRRVESNRSGTDLQKRLERISREKERQSRNE